MTFLIFGTPKFRRWWGKVTNWIVGGWLFFEGIKVTTGITILSPVIFIPWGILAGLSLMLVGYWIHRVGRGY